MNIYAQYHPRNLFIRDNPEQDQKHLLFHIETGDYFATLATILTLTMDLSPNLDKQSKEVLAKAHRDLVYLQKTHAIVSKDKS